MAVSNPVTCTVAPDTPVIVRLPLPLLTTETWSSSLMLIVSLAPSNPRLRSTSVSPEPLESEAGVREQLHHHADDIAALGDAVAMAAMRARDVVVRPEMAANADRRGFLAGVEMHEARDMSLGEFVLYALLEPADRNHVAPGFQKRLSI